MLASCHNRQRGMEGFQFGRSSLNRDDDLRQLYGLVPRL